MSDKPRPSSLPNLEACPRWVSRPRTEKISSMDEAADEGTLVHAKMEALAEVPVDKWEDTIWNDPDLGPALAPVVAEAASQVRDLFSMCLPVVTKRTLNLQPDDHYELGQGMSDADVASWSCLLDDNRRRAVGASWDILGELEDGIYCEVGVDPEVTRPGTADIVVVTGNRAVLVDYKTVRVIREHLSQMLAYVIGVFNAAPRVDYVEVRIVAPRLGANTHEAVTFSRADDLPRIKAELEGIVARAADEFTPGCPGEQCVTCKGNGRCSFQCASLKDVPVEVSALVQPNAWLPMLNAVSPDMRGQRRKLVKWLGDFCDAVKDQDKEWALANPDTELPGFTKSIQAGRASLDKTRLAEVSQSLMLRFGLTAEVLSAFSVPDKEQLAEYVALGQGMTQADAELAIKQCMNPFMKRGNDIVAFRAVKPKKGELKA